MVEYNSPQRPEGCKAVVILSDGIRLILGDGTVARVEIEDFGTGDSIPCVAPGEGVYSDMEENGIQVEFNLPTDDEAATHPMVRESLEDLGFWDEHATD